MSNQTETKELTIEEIDETLNKLDALLATLPLDYQMDYAQEIMDRLVDTDD